MHHTSSLLLLAAALALPSLIPAPVLAAGAELPACAVTGARSVFINGRPALRLADVAGCPPGMFETVPGLFIEGQPAVRLSAPKEGCIASGSSNVIAGGGMAPRAGDVACPPAPQR
ncbi:Uncharacterized conserved protein [Pannonibacter phragmitetus]|uniref:Uncharacterized conserved protein n=1 Tax=Pannonibacter phragmitetus TaxID=121719 RepID=A0A378ZXM4_9HYPH|nr:PAAR domain-containing protein [Pannonibacter phragmitetus]SUB01984.1 Uncharacterized conserved protein [Pannonibacter phragmitetus]